MIVLTHCDGAMHELAQEVAEILGARCMPFDRRPELALYDLVVLVTQIPAALDPRLVGFAALELRGRGFALLTDGGPIGEGLFWAVNAAALFGGARIQPPFHASLGWLADTRERSFAGALEWARSLAGRYPAPSFPRGFAGKREIE